MLPRTYETFRRVYPDIFKAYDRLGTLAHEHGTLGPKTREFIKLAMAIGAKLEGAVHSHARQALDAGGSPNEVRQAVLLGLTTLGFPSTMAALTWVEDVLKETARRKKRQKKK